MNAMNPMIVKKLEQSADKVLNNRIETALHLGQNEFKADIFDFARWFNIKYPKQWEQNKKQWDDIFPSVKVSFDTKVQIERPGGSSGPPAYPEDEVINK